jgi:hypothetical protein
MSIASTLGSVGIAIVSGGAAGYLSSVYAAGPVAYRQETARRHIQAREHLYQVVTAYNGRLRTVHDERSIYPVGYADLASREQFAEDVVAIVQNLPHSITAGVLDAMSQLAGEKTMRLAFRRRGVPADARPSEDDEKNRRENEERLMGRGYHDGVGCRDETRHLCERDHYPQLQKDYGELAVLWLTTVHPHNYHHQDAYEKVQQLLGQIELLAMPGGQVRVGFMPVRERA